MKGDKTFYLKFMREEINHVEMAMEVRPEDIDSIKAMTDDQLYCWIHDKQMSGDKDEAFYCWDSGKEYCEGEGERGTFDYKLHTYTENESQHREMGNGRFSQIVSVTLTNKEDIGGQQTSGS